MVSLQFQLSIFIDLAVLGYDVSIAMDTYGDYISNEKNLPVHSHHRSNSREYRNSLKKHKENKPIWTHDWWKTCLAFSDPVCLVHNIEIYISIREWREVERKKKPWYGKTVDPALECENEQTDRKIVNWNCFGLIVSIVQVRFQKLYSLIVR